MRPRSLLLIIVIGFSTCFSSLSGQIYIDIYDNGVGGIDITASGSAVVTSRGRQSYNVGVNNFGCLYPDEDFQDLCQNGFQSTLNGGAWAFGGVGGSYTDTVPGNGITFNGTLLNSFSAEPQYFALYNLPAALIAPSDGVTPVTASGTLSCPTIPFSSLPASPPVGGQSIVSVYGAGQIVFRINAPPPQLVPTLSEWGLILLGLVFLCMGSIVVWKQRIQLDA